MWKKRQNSNNVIADDVMMNSDNEMVRSVVEQELRQQGVAVVTPGKMKTTSSVSSPTTTILPTQEAITPNNSQVFMDSSEPDECYDLSEEELYELLKEVEEEIRRNEEELLEEVLEQERCQQEEIEQQIAEFEEWEESLAMHEMNPKECVICPICCESMLQRSCNKTFCPNEACPLQLDDNQGLSLAELKERLRLAFEDHSHHCGGTLIFEMGRSGKNLDSTQDKQTLVGSCHYCSSSFKIT